VLITNVPLISKKNKQPCCSEKIEVYSEQNGSQSESPWIFKMEFMNMEYLADCKQLVQFTMYESIHYSATYGILLYNDTVVLQTHNALYSLPLTSNHTLSHVLQTLKFDCYAIDITSRFTLNHITNFIMHHKLHQLYPLTMNIYTSKFMLQSMISTQSLPPTKAIQETVFYSIQPTHIAAVCAEFVLE
jgi:hypothetical protein